MIGVKDLEGSPAGFDGPRAILLEGLFAQMATATESFDVLGTRAGVEIRRSAGPDRPAGRPRILLFPADRDRVVAFFFKPSRLSFSRDRFSYGALYLYAARVEDSTREFAAALAYLAADFKPDAKPERLKRSLDVTVPESD